MGQKVNPHGLRVGVIKNWDSRWYVNAKEMGDTIVSDYKIREYVRLSFSLLAFPRLKSSVTLLALEYSSSAQSPVL